MWLIDVNRAPGWSLFGCPTKYSNYSNKHKYCVQGQFPHFAAPALPKGLPHYRIVLTCFDQTWPQPCLIWGVHVEEKEHAQEVPCDTSSRRSGHLFNIAIYHLVMTNSSPWKDPPFLIGKPVNHLFLWVIYTMAIWVCLKLLCTPKNPMVLLIIIPFLNGYFIGSIPHFQTYPYVSGYAMQWQQPTSAGMGWLRQVLIVSTWHQKHHDVGV